MMHTAEVLLKVFAEHRGRCDRDLGPRRPALDADQRYRDWICRWAIRRWAVIPGSDLGLALAQPDKRVVLFDSEGDILMSLGQLADHRRTGAGEFLSFHPRQ